MRFFFFVSLSPFANTFCGEKREKRDERGERGERDYISPVRDVSEEKQKRIIEEYSHAKAKKEQIHRSIFYLIATS